MNKQTIHRTKTLGTANVVEAAKKRISYLFDNYDNIELSYSGGKDSTVLFHLLNAEAKKRNRKFNVFFQDQEAEYQGTIDMVDWVMRQPNVNPYWYQVPIFMTNACSSQQMFLWAWGKDEKWVRPKSDIAITEIKGRYPRRFYKFAYWRNHKFNEEEGKCVCVVGLRAEESPSRRFVMFGEDSELFWMRRKKEPNKAYPIIDWSFTDVWKFLCENNLKYNKVYDKMYQLGMPLRTMRVSNLIHEKSYRCLHELQELEPETYQALEDRLQGVHCAAIYSREGLMYSIRKLPKEFETWKQYKDFLLDNIHPDLAKIFRWQWNRFGDTDDVGACKYMVRRILLADWEGNLTWARDNEFNYTKEQLAEKRVLKKQDETIKKWFDKL